MKWYKWTIENIELNTWYKCIDGAGAEEYIKILEYTPKKSVKCYHIALNHPVIPNTFDIITDLEDFEYELDLWNYAEIEKITDLDGNLEEKYRQPFIKVILASGGPR